MLLPSGEIHLEVEIEITSGEGLESWISELHGGWLLGGRWLWVGGWVGFDISVRKIKATPPQTNAYVRPTHLLAPADLLTPDLNPPPKS